MRWCLLVGLLGLAWPARAQTTLYAGGAELDPESGQLSVVIGGRGKNGAPTSVSDPQLLVDGKETVEAAGRQKIGDYASEHPDWVPPVAIGVVYLWASGTPQSVLEGLEALFRHVPRKTAVYPTLYGQGMRQVVTKVTAARVAGGDLAEYPQVKGEQIRMVEAAQGNLAKLLEDPAPIKMMFIVTDGRGAERRDELGPFALLGDELRRKGVHVAVVSFPPPADPQDAAANVRELVEAARAQHVMVERIADLPALIESVAENVSAMERVRFPLPWMLRQSGGARKLVVKATIGGAVLRSAPSTVELPGGSGLLVLILGAVGVLLVGGGAGIFLLRRRKVETPSVPVGRGRGKPPARGRSRDDDEDQERGEEQGEAEPDDEASAAEDENEDPMIEASARAVRLGLRPARAVLALSRALGPAAETIATTDARSLGRENPWLASKAGQARLREIRRLLGENRAEDAFSRELAPALVASLRERSRPEEAARRLRAKLPVETWSALLRLSEQDITRVINALASAVPDLAGPGVAEFAQAVRAELARPSDGSGTLFWLVRAAGPGTVGETFVIEDVAAFGGREGEQVSPGDDGSRGAIARVEIDGDDPRLVPLAGKPAATLDGAAVSGPSPLRDGQTIACGRSLYVVRLCRWSFGGGAAPRAKPHAPMGGATRPGRVPTRR